VAYLKKEDKKYGNNENEESRKKGRQLHYQRDVFHEHRGGKLSNEGKSAVEGNLPSRGDSELKGAFS